MRSGICNRQNIMALNNNSCYFDPKYETNRNVRKTIKNLELL